MKNISIIFALLTFNFYSCSQPISGYWTGAIELNGKTVDLSLDLNFDKPTCSSYDLMLLEKPIANLRNSNGNFDFSLILDVELYFKGELKNDQIKGVVQMQNGPPNMDMSFDLAKQAQLPEKPYDIETLSINSNGEVLSANYYKQKMKGKHPAIVLLHGSTLNYKNDYVFRADYFAKLGFEVLIFDKRGNGKSTGDYYLSSYDDLIADAIVCLETVLQRKSVDKNKIGLWGISQGAMLLPKIASVTDIPKFLIAESPEIDNVSEAAAFSDSLRIVNAGFSETNGHIAAESHRTVRQMILKGSSHNEVEKFIHQNAQKYNFMDQTGLYGNINIDKDEFYGFYWQGRKESFLSLWKNLKIPSLVLFGGRDNFVNTERNLSILKSVTNENIEVKRFPKANHMLKKSFNPVIDTEFDFPRIIEGYAEHVEHWIKKVDE